MHPEAKHFMDFCRATFSEFFINKKVLDVGSGDINGNNRYLFTNCDYTGNDVSKGPNVTIVSKTHLLSIGENTFDTIVSTECFEHDPFYEMSFKKINSMLKPGGLLCFTCASTGRPEHGTRRSHSRAALSTINNIEDMQDYYKNLTIEDVAAAIDLKEFSVYYSYYNSKSYDLYFVGVKKPRPVFQLPIYKGVSCTLTGTSATVTVPPKPKPKITKKLIALKMR